MVCRSPADNNSGRDTSQRTTRSKGSLTVKMKKAGWRLIQAKQLVPKYQLTNASLHPSITAHSHKTRTDCVMLTFPITILTKMQEMWKEECSAFHKDTLTPSINELLKHIAMRTYMSIHPKTRIKDHWKKRPQYFSTRRDFLEINKNLPLDIDHAIEEQNKAMLNTFISGTARMADETIIPKSGKRSKVTKIMRKPHPLGHEIKNEGQLLGGRPIMTRYMYKKEGVKTTVDQIVADMLKYRFAEHTHFIGDCWFNSANSRDWMDKNHIEYTVTSNPAHDPRLWTWLGGGETGIHVGRVKYAYNDKTGEVAAIANGAKYTRYRSTFFNCLDRPDPEGHPNPVRSVYNSHSRIIDSFNTYFYKFRWLINTIQVPLHFLMLSGALLVLMDMPSINIYMERWNLGRTSCGIYLLRCFTSITKGFHVLGIIFY